MSQTESRPGGRQPNGAIGQTWASRKTGTVIRLLIENLPGEWVAEVMATHGHLGRGLIPDSLLDGTAWWQCCDEAAEPLRPLTPEMPRGVPSGNEVAALDALIAGLQKARDHFGRAMILRQQHEPGPAERATAAAWEELRKAAAMPWPVEWK